MGTPPPNIMTTLICSMTRNASRMRSAVNCSNDSAQSPPCQKISTERVKPCRRAVARSALPQDLGSAQPIMPINTYPLKSVPRL